MASHACAGRWRQEAEGTALALTLGHAVMAYLSGVPWLAKDVVWVLPDARCGLIESAEVNFHSGRGAASACAARSALGATN